MRALPLFIVIGGMAACSGSGDTPAKMDNLATNLGFLGGPITISYNPTTDIYTVTPFGEDRLRMIGNPDSDRGGFDASIPDPDYPQEALSMMLNQRGDGNVAMIAFPVAPDSDVRIGFTRSADTTIPTVGNVSYDGEYFGYFYHVSVPNEIYGDATIRIGFADTATISGEVTNRVMYDRDDPDLVYANPTDLILEENTLTSDGRVSLSDTTPPTVSAEEFLYDTGEVFGVVFYTADTGFYDGVVSGPEGEHFLGGVEVTYLGPTSAKEYGIIAVSQTP